MPVILFLVDNTPSMLQQSMHNGARLSYMDVAKQMVDTFLKLRESHEDKKLDRYTLLTYDTPPNNVKVCWNESSEQFNNALKNVQCTGSIQENAALGNAFDLLNQERMKIGMDTYGWGRRPVNSMYSFIVLITNYRHTPTDRNERLVMPPGSISTGLHLTNEAYRWDQRLFALVLGSSRCSTFLSQLCHKTGGWCMAIKHKRMMIYSMTKLMASLKYELMVTFVHETEMRSTIGEASLIELQATRCTIACCSYTAKSSWPLPESYWPREDQTELEHRLAHPEMRILSTCCDEPVWQVDVPIDKYAVKECKQPNAALPVTDCGKVWPVVIKSTDGHKEQPFGYLKKEDGKILFYVLPYNYPELHRVIAENCTELNVKNQKFMYSMQHYINCIPRYYRYYLRRGLSGILKESVLQTLLPPEQKAFMNASITNELNQMQKVAKQQYHNMFSYLANQPPASATTKVPEMVERLNLPQLLAEETDPEMRKNFMRPVVLPARAERSTPPDIRNPYTIDRSDLLGAFHQMRNAFYHPDTIADMQRSQPSGTVDRRHGSIRGSAHQRDGN